MSRYGLKFERKEEKCEEMLKTHHLYLEDDERSFVRDEKKHHNILIEGENLHALKVLKYTHSGKVDVIYLDPPYNTGNKDFVYNDAFVDEEDSFRHSKWLSFMEKRLKIARELLSERGVIFLSIDDNEFAQLKMLCDEVFGEQNFIANMIWKKKDAGAMDSGNIATEHEYILVYALHKESLFFNKLPSDKTDNTDYYDLKDDYAASRGQFRLMPLAMGSIQYSETMDFAITAPDNTEVFPGGFKEKGNGKWSWRWSKDKVKWGLENDFLEIHNGISCYGWDSKSSKWVIRRLCKRPAKTPKAWMINAKQYQFVDNEGNRIERTAPLRTIINDVFTKTAAYEMKAIFGSQSALFDYAKPVSLIKRLLFVASQKDSIVLDFFAGSGTTGQAVAELNKEDGGTRQFILVTNNDKSEKLPDGICAQVTFPRLEKTIGNENLKVFKTKTLKKVEGINSQLMQLEVEQRLLPVLCLANNTFKQIEKNATSMIFEDHSGSNHIGVFSNTNGKQKPINPRELAKFQDELEKKYPDAVLLVNRPARGYVREYVEFMR